MKYEVERKPKELGKLEDKSSKQLVIERTHIVTLWSPDGAKNTFHEYFWAGVENKTIQLRLSDSARAAADEKPN